MISSPCILFQKNGEVEDVPYLVPISEANLFEVWDEAQKLASEFRDRTNFRSFNLQKHQEKNKKSPDAGM